MNSFHGRFPEWPKGADCKSVVADFGGPNPPSPTKIPAQMCGYFFFSKKFACSFPSPKGRFGQDFRCYARRFRPHPALARKLLAVFLPPPGGRLGQDFLRECVRRFRPHPSLARHLPHPGEGFFWLCKFCYILLLNPAYKSALYLSNTNCRSSLPPGGEGGAPATDEGEIGERTTEYASTGTKTATKRRPPEGKRLFSFILPYRIRT